MFMIIHSHGACYVEPIAYLVFLPMAFLSLTKIISLLFNILLWIIQRIVLEYSPNLFCYFH